VPSRSINTGAEGWKKEKRPAHASASECWDMRRGHCKEELTESDKTPKKKKQKKLEKSHNLKKSHTISRHQAV
jgi:hypothetical protein